MRSSSVSPAWIRFAPCCQHANHYGLKFIFVHDPFYEPLLVFGGWRQVESYESGAITVWSKDDAPPARAIPSDAMPAPWEGLIVGHPAHWQQHSGNSVCVVPGRAATLAERIIAVPRETPEGVYDHGVRS